MKSFTIGLVLLAATVATLGCETFKHRRYEERTSKIEERPQPTPREGERRTISSDRDVQRSEPVIIVE